MPAKEPETMRLRFRRGATIDGKTFAGGAHEAVEISDDAWAAVNRGDADLDPPPGVAGQPNPEDIPEELTDAPAPAPLTPMMQQAAAAVPVASPKAAKVGADYDSMTVEDLHQEASKRNLEGRSGLDKAGLVKALEADDKKRARKGG
jgi:hypothetical protein